MVDLTSGETVARLFYGSGVLEVKYSGLVVGVVGISDELVCFFILRC